MPMRFLILTQYYAPEVGAAQVRLSATVRELVRLGHTVEVVTGIPNYPEGRTQAGYRGRAAMTERRDGVTVRRTWLFPATGSGFNRMANYASFSLTSLAGLAASDRPDVVFVESPPPTLVVPAWLVARRWGAQLVMNVSDLWPDSIVELGLSENRPLLAATRRLERWAYEHADYVTAVTEGMRRTLVETKGVPPHRVLFLPNGVDTELFRPRPPDRQLAERLALGDRRVVLMAGSMNYSAGLDVILDAAPALEQRGVVVVLVGAGSDRQRLEMAAAERGLRNVQFLGPVPVEDVACMYSVADIGLMTLRDSPLFEGTRAARILPAMASGLPVVYSGSGEGARLVTDADAGLATAPQDPAALAAAIGRLLDDPDLAARMGAAGRRFVESQLSWPRLVEAWVSDLQRRTA
jgi:glycosyltransferase involved in cell wall biosynthesis